MAEGKKTFIFYSDWINMVREMPDVDAGVLLKHVLSYVNDEEPTTDNLLVKMAFGHMKPMLKKDLEKWAKQLQKYSDMGKLSAEKRKNQHKATQVEPTSTQVEPMNTVNDNVNVSVTHYSESVFLENWTKCREHYLKKPTNIKKLNFIESNEFNAIKKLYSKEEINEAMQTLFKQERIPVDAMVLRPKHFLEKFDTYYTGKNNTKIYGANV